MCGIAGIFYKEADGASAPPVGAQLVKMMAAMRHRGYDSTGFTIAGEGVREGEILARLYGEPPSDPPLSAADAAIRRLGARVRSRARTGDHLRLVLAGVKNLKALADALLAVPGLEIHSLGRSSEVIKDVGDANDLDRRHGVSSRRGSHGLGHNRLATESRVDVNHSHPFWAYPFPDVTTVHNGQLTNYHRLRRIYEGRGFRFQTHNDSELIAVYLAEKLAEGQALAQALQRSISDFDGTYTYFVSTPHGIGYAKDKLAAKPLVVMERDDVVALASEEVALRQVFPEEIDRIEPQQSQHRVWERGAE